MFTPETPTSVGDTTRQAHVMVDSRGLRHRAGCSCGWDGEKRLFLAAAKLDALTHSAETGHFPAEPPAARAVLSDAPPL
jgi:hypothetical protein